MNVAFMLDGFDIGGTELHAIRLAEALARDERAIRIHIAHLHGSGPLLDRYQALAAPMRRFAIKGLVTPSAVAAGAQLRSQLRAWKIDVFHSHDVYGNIFGVPWARAAGVPAVIASRRWWDSLPRPGLARLNRGAYGLAHRVVANAPSVARLLVEQERVAPAKVVTLENFLADAAFDAPSTESIRARRAALGLDPDALVIGMVARLAPVKNARMLLQAAAQLGPEFPTVQVAFVGDGPDRTALEREAAAIGLGPRIVFPGTLPNQPSPHQLFDVSVLTSNSEGFPNSVAEAMASGRPVVATDVGGVPDVVAPGRSGVLVPAGDVGALADALRRLLADGSLRRSLGDAARAVARDRFSERTAIDALLDVYRSGVARSGSERR